MPFAVLVRLLLPIRPQPLLLRPHLHLLEFYQLPLPLYASVLLPHPDREHLLVGSPLRSLLP